MRENEKQREKKEMSEIFIFTCVYNIYKINTHTYTHTRTHTHTHTHTQELGIVKAKNQTEALFAEYRSLL